MALARRTVFDFIAQVNAQTPGRISGATYSASLNSDGTVAITKNGVSLYSKVAWAMGVGTAITDANISGDTVSVLSGGPEVAHGDAQQFLYSLT